MSEAMGKQKEQLGKAEAHYRTKLETETRSLNNQINQLRKEVEFQKQRQFLLQETISSKIKEVEGLKQEKESLLTRYHVFQLYFNNISHIPHCPRSWVIIIFHPLFERHPDVHWSLASF